MKLVRVGDEVKGVVFFNPDKQTFHSRVFPKNVVPVMAKGRQRHGNVEGLASNPVEFAGRDLPPRVGLLKPGKKETLPDLLRRKT